MSYLMNAMRHVVNSLEFEVLVTRTLASAGDPSSYEAWEDTSCRKTPMEAENLQLRSERDNFAAKIRLLTEERDSYLATILSHQEYGAEMRKKLADAEARLGRADKLLTQYILDKQALQQRIKEVASPNQGLLDANAILGAENLLLRNERDKARADVVYVKSVEIKTAGELRTARERVTVVEEERDRTRAQVNYRCAENDRLQLEITTLRRQVSSHVDVLTYWKERAEGPKDRGLPPF